MKVISAFVFATRIVQFLFYLNPKFQDSSNLLSLHSPVCVGPGRKPRRPVFSRRGSYDPCHEKTCFMYMPTTELPISLCSLSSAFVVSCLGRITSQKVWLCKLTSYKYRNAENRFSHERAHIKLIHLPRVHPYHSRHVTNGPSSLNF